MSWKKTLEEARPDAEQLSRLTDDLNAAIASVEKVFVAQNFGVSASVTFQCDGLDYELWYGKHMSSWGLFVNGDCGKCALLSAPRSLRVEAVRHLDALARAMVSEVGRQVAEVSGALLDVVALTSELSRAGAAGDE